MTDTYATTEQSTFEVADKPEGEPVDREQPTEACVRYDECGNTVPEGLDMCPECMDAVRAQGRDES